MRRHLMAAGAAAAAIATLAAGCGGGSSPVRATRSTGAPRSVRVAVHGTPRSGVVVIAPVAIDGHGPYRFVLDTGASRSVIDTKLARRLGLHVVRSGARLTGVNAASAAGATTIRHWRLGRVSLHPQRVYTLSLAEDRRGPHLGGLLGSDILSHFGSVLIDYQHEQLVLRPRRRGGG